MINKGGGSGRVRYREREERVRQTNRQTEEREGDVNVVTVVTKYFLLRYKFTHIYVS